MRVKFVKFCSGFVLFCNLYYSVLDFPLNFEGNVKPPIMNNSKYCKQRLRQIQFCVFLQPHLNHAAFADINPTYLDPDEAKSNTKQTVINSDEKESKLIQFITLPILSILFI